MAARTPAPTRLSAAGAYTPYADGIGGGQAPWSPGTRIAFRFCFVYFGLYVLLTQMLACIPPLPNITVQDLSTYSPFRQAIVWLGAHVLGITRPISAATTGSGDKTFDWVLSFAMLSIAAIATIIWSLADREGTNHARIYRWFRVFLRIAVGTSLLTYGFAKAPPMQMPILSLKRLVEPYGSFSPMGVLWSSVGASPAYEVFVGLAEIFGGTLVLIPRFATFGALIALMDTIEVFTLNMTYDVPVKLFSFHLVLMSIFLLAPNLSRIGQFFFLNRAVELAPEPTLGATASRRRIANILQVLFAATWIAVGAGSSWSAWKKFGPSAARPPIFGIWNVEHMVVDGVERAPLSTDSTRYRRLVAQTTRGLSFQRFTDAFRDYTTQYDSTAQRVSLTSVDKPPVVSTLTYARKANQLIMDGTLDGHAVHFELSFVDPDSFLQRSRGFHFISERPFNR